MTKERYKCEFENQCDGEACDICLQSLIDSVTEENKQLKERLKLAVDALEKYAEFTNWKASTVLNHKDGGYSYSSDDRFYKKYAYEIAREALNKIENKEVWL